ncbi:MAG: hypothetical protein GX187_01975 [Clostridiaceae bacterium]|nr:hypothetical protein [Clostridiaceae bacterium]
MRKLYYLLNEEFRQLLKPLTLICLFNTIGQLLLIKIKAKDFEVLASRFEYFYASSGCMILFTICLLAVTGLFVTAFYKHYWGSKSIYTLLTLPADRIKIYLVMLVSFYLGLMLFYLINFVTVYLTYILYVSELKNIYMGEMYILNNGLFLAFVRSGIFRVIFPLTFNGRLFLVLTFLLIPAVILFSVISERGLRYKNLILSGFSIFLTVLGISQRIETFAKTPVLALMSVLFVLIVTMSIKLFNKNSIS